jgi:glucose/arabinose dehydrogenase
VSSPQAGGSPVSSPAAAGCPGAFAGPVAPLPVSTAVALAFAPDGRLFYAERAGTVRVFQGGQPLSFASVETVTTEAGGGYSERGLLGLTVSPTFARDHYVYALYSETDRVHQRVVRWTDDCQGHGAAEATVVEGLPTGGDCCHKGGRIAFGPDGDLYVTLGDNHTAAAAQDKCDVRGKILRYTPAGQPAPGNLCGAVYAYGLRNPFGIAFAPDGRLFVTANGPSGDAGSPGTGYDMATTIVAGGNYQWPFCYGYSHPIGASLCPAGSHPPDYSTEASTVVPTGAAWVAGGGPLGGHFVFCTFISGVLKVFDGPAQVHNGPTGCTYDVKQAPDGGVYAAGQAAISRVSG